MNKSKIKLFLMSKEVFILISGFGVAVEYMNSLHSELLNEMVSCFYSSLHASHLLCNIQYADNAAPDQPTHLHSLI